MKKGNLFLNYKLLKRKPSVRSKKEKREKKDHKLPAFPVFCIYSDDHHPWLSFL